MKIKVNVSTRKYRCARCGYIAQRKTPPENCAICRSPADYFEDVGVDAPERRQGIFNPKLI